MDGVSSAITEAGGKIASVEPMDTRSFARVANRRIKSGYYFSMVFEIGGEGLRKVQDSLRENRHVFRSSIQLAGERAPFKPAQKAEAASPRHG